MAEKMRRSGCGSYPDPDDKDKKDKACDIESICCENFVKEQFSLQAIATNAVLKVYEATPNANITRGTVKIINLSNHFINFTVNSTNLVVGPNQEAAITAANLLEVKVQINGQGMTAKVKLCFDLQVVSFEVV